MKTPLGFRFAGLHVGIKPSRRDLALVVSELPCAAVGCFTVNRAKAAPVVDAEARLPSREARALVINAGNANALTGEEGVADVQAVHRAFAAALGYEAASIFSASTGVIGMRLPVQKIVDGAPALVGQLGEDPAPAAEAIMTTDTRLKMGSRVAVLAGREVTIAGFCKGSGMIAPQLATMIAVIVTDAAIEPEVLQWALRRATASSFNRIVVDGDMSTNDSVFALANGMAGHPPIRATTQPEAERFAAALEELCLELARDIALDGEGATKLLEVVVKEAPTAAIAGDLATAIAKSPLVKAAFFGADPNWGRVLATVGARAGAEGWEIRPAEAQVRIGGVVVYDRAPLPFDGPALRRSLRGPEVRVEVALRAGSERALAWGCDLSYDYVKINADYTSLIVPGQDGGVEKDDRLGNYSPRFKVMLLVEALSYIANFAGRRCVVKYGGAAMVKESLKRSFCEDISLLHSVGLRPIVVHGGGPGINATLAQLGRRPQFIDGLRVTDDADLKIVEMVLTGSINTELVTLLNRMGEGHAVGISGKDSALLRARKLLGPAGRDLGQVGEVTGVNTTLLETLLAENYIPVISPVAIGEDGQSYNVNADHVAARLAAALGAHKLIYLTDVPGVLEGGEPLSTLSATALAAKLEAGGITGGMKAKAQAALEALRDGVPAVHVLDGRTPHSLIAELFTHAGVGTLITAE